MIPEVRSSLKPSVYDIFTIPEEPGAEPGANCGQPSESARHPIRGVAEVAAGLEKSGAPREVLRPTATAAHVQLSAESLSELRHRWALTWAKVATYRAVGSGGSSGGSLLALPTTTNMTETNQHRDCATNYSTSSPHAECDPSGALAQAFSTMGDSGDHLSGPLFETWIDINVKSDTSSDDYHSMSSNSSFSFCLNNSPMPRAQTKAAKHYAAIANRLRDEHSFPQGAAIANMLRDKHSSPQGAAIANMPRDKHSSPQGTFQSTEPCSKQHKLVHGKTHSKHPQQHVSASSPAPYAQSVHRHTTKGSETSNLSDFLPHHQE
eukprot:gene6938-30927_t